jgi:glutamate-5-semialdehyde dehydrogenase
MNGSERWKEIGRRGQESAQILNRASSVEKNLALDKMSLALMKNTSYILEENEKDMVLGREKGLPNSLLDRLMLDEKRIRDMADGLQTLINLEDPIGEVTGMKKRPNGLVIGKKRVPLGVVGIIYEARPNVTVDAAGLCLKTGNAVILKGGSEAFFSNQALTGVLREALTEAGLPEDCIQFIASRDRGEVDRMIKMNGYLDVIIPRGGAGLIKHVVQHATVPVIETGMGNCHTYIDRDADPEMAISIAVNAKTHRPGVCNAMETLLIHGEIAPLVLPALQEKLEEKGVSLRGCAKICALLPGVIPATELDWSTEYLDLILAVKLVESMEEALDHIHKYGTKHSEAIVTNHYGQAQRFLDEVDAAAVYVNASTRFTDGGQFGFGAEIGISTQKLHARGPMGLEALTTIKYIVYGIGQIRS